MSKIKQIKQKTNTDTGWSDSYPLGADVKNIDNITGIDLEELLYFDDPHSKIEIYNEVDIESDLFTDDSSIFPLLDNLEDTEYDLFDKGTIIKEAIRNKDNNETIIEKGIIISSNYDWIKISFRNKKTNSFVMKDIKFTNDGTNVNNTTITSNKYSDKEE